MKNILQFLGLTQENRSFIWKRIKEQFNLFFSNQYSKPFIIICLGIIVASAIYSGSVVSDLKQGIDTKIEQREEEIANEMFGQGFEQAAAEYDKRKEDYQKCLSERANCVVEEIYWFGYKNAEERAYKDPAYQEFLHIEETSVSRLFIEKFVKNFSFGWWGVIALAAVFLINILIALIKLSAWRTKKLNKIWENAGEHLGVIALAFVYAIGITLFILFPTQIVLNVLNVNINLIDTVIPFLYSMPLSLFIILLIWVGIISFHIKDTIDTNQ